MASDRLTISDRLVKNARKIGVILLNGEEPRPEVILPAGLLLEEQADEIDRLRARVAELELQRDAALASAFYAPQFVRMPEPDIFRRLGQALRAWMDPDDEPSARRQEIAAGVLAELDAPATEGQPRRPLSHERRAAIREQIERDLDGYTTEDDY